MYLLLDDLQQVHGASLDTDTAGDALGSRALALHDHDLHGAGFHALAAADAQLLVDHEYTGLGILSDCTMLAGTHALAALDAHHGLCTSTLGHDLDATEILVKLLVESGGTGPDALQTCHALHAFFRHKFLHNKGSPLLFYYF